MKTLQQFLTSCKNEAPFRPVRSDTITQADLEALEKLNISMTGEGVEMPSSIAGVQKSKVDIASLEAKANGE